MMIKATTELKESVPKEPKGSPGEVKYGFSFWKPSNKKGLKWEQITSRLVEEPVLVATMKSQVNSWGQEVHATKAKFVWGVVDIGGFKHGPLWQVFKEEIPEGADASFQE